MNIAASADIDGNRQTALYGQDLYRIFSNCAYTCDVEAIGNAQILPMMYFQLNNVPMWKGAYFITRVEHNISAGDMKTNFSGVRLNKVAIPLKGGDVSFLRDFDTFINTDLNIYMDMETFTVLGNNENEITQVSNFNMSEFLYNVYYRDNRSGREKGRKLCENYGPLITKHLIKNNITQSHQIAMFVAQIGVESGCLIYTREIADGSAYEGRKDLGNYDKGDGVKYKGRGLIQVTGKSNYQQVSNYTGIDYINNPEWMERDEDAVITACWYWTSRNLNNYAHDITQCTKIINGGKKDLNRRAKYYEKALYEIKKYVEFNNDNNA
jgi:putative chitinase